MYFSIVRIEQICRNFSVYNSHNKSIEFGKAPDGALSIYKLGCEAAQGNVGSVARLLRHGYHKNKASRLRRRISNNLLYSVYAKTQEKRLLFMPIINGLAL